MSSHTVVQRLELIKNMIQLGETSSLDEQAEQLRATSKSTALADSLNQIADCLSDDRYSEAVSRIDTYLRSEAAIQSYENPRLSALRLEAEALEQKLTELENEKAEIEREIHAFNLRHEQELGPLLEEILRIRTERKRQRAEEQPDNEEAQSEFREAKTEYEEYSETVEAAEEEERIELTDDEKEELKRLYRDASKQCHPDAVVEDREEEAKELFVQLQDAYEQNDLDAVRTIAERIEDGVAFESRSEQIDDIERLEAEVERLRRRVNEAEREIEVLRNSDPYQTLSEVDDLDAYFSDRKERLRDELDRLRDEKSISA